MVLMLDNMVVSLNVTKVPVVPESKIANLVGSMVGTMAEEGVV